MKHLGTFPCFLRCLGIQLPLTCSVFLSGMEDFLSDRRDKKRLALNESALLYLLVIEYLQQAIEFFSYGFKRSLCDCSWLFSRIRIGLPNLSYIIYLSLVSALPRF